MRPLHTSAILDGPPGTTESLDEHLARLGLPPDGTPALIDALAAAGLRGRGGAGFPAHRKWEAVYRQGAAGRVVVIGNAAESEPASEKDRVLLRTRPHLVLDGLRLSAQALGARDVVLYVRHDDDAGRHAVAAAIQERRGRNDPRIAITVAPPRYVAGEETAVIARIEGRDAKPRDTPPRPHRRGAWKRPTLVQNVETLARIALIARGIDAGDHALLTVRTSAGATVMDVPVGTPLADVITRTGVAAESLRAILVGGYFGTWIEPAAGGGLGTDIGIGAGVIALLDTAHCGVAETSRLLSYLAGESAGQCGPCMFGLPAMAEVLAGIREGRGRQSGLDRLSAWTRDLPGRGACRHPDGAARLTGSALTVFSREINAHLRSGACPRCPASPLLPIPRYERGWR